MDVKQRELAKKVADSENRTDEPIYNLIRKKFMNEESDKVREKERVKEKRLKRKLKAKALNDEKTGRAEVIAQLGTPSDEDGEGYDEEEGYDDEDGEEYDDEDGGDFENDDDEEMSD